MGYRTIAILWCISASAQAPVQPKAAPVPSTRPEDKCSIEGAVVSATTGEPLKKTHLTLRAISQPDGVPYGTTTDSAGHFVLDGIDPGRYSFSASHNGYLIHDYSPRGDATHSTPLMLGIGQKLKDVVFKLTPQGVITGRVLDEDGEPLDNVSVEVGRLEYWRGKRRLMGREQTYTNDLGEYRVRALSPGKYVISATYEAQDAGAFTPVGSAPVVQEAEEAFVTTFYPSATTPERASLIDVTAGAKISGINLTLSRARTVSLKGRVIFGATAQWQRTTVMLLPRDLAFTSSPVSGRVSDPKGSFVLRGVPPGSFVLYAQNASEGKRYSARLPVEVGNSNIEGIELTLLPPLEVPGHVIIEANGDLKGTIVNLALQPRSPSSVFGGGFGQLKDDLSFKLQNASLGSYDLNVFQLPESFYVKAIRIGQEDVTEAGIDLTQGIPPEELSVILNPNGGQIEGLVKNAKDEPAIGAKVTLIPDAGHQSLTWLYKIANTDQNGRYVIKGVRPGEYKIYAWEELEEGAYQDPDFVKPHESAGETLRIKEGAHEVLELKAIPSIGTVGH